MDKSAYFSIKKKPHNYQAYDTLQQSFLKWPSSKYLS